MDGKNGVSRGDAEDVWNEVQGLGDLGMGRVGECRLNCGAGFQPAECCSLSGAIENCTRAE